MGKTHALLGSVLLGSVLLTGCAALTGEVADTSAGRVTALQGEAIVRRGEPSQVQSLGMDSRVFPKDVVQTRDGSRCRITLQDQTVLTLGERSEIAIEEFSQRNGTGSKVVKVITGIVKLATSVLFPPSGGLNVLTTVAALFFSGTEVIVETTPSRTAVASLEGTVRVRSLQAEAPGEVELKPGEGTDIEPGQAPTPARRWGAARLERVKQATALP